MFVGSSNRDDFENSFHLLLSPGVITKFVMIRDFQVTGLLTMRIYDAECNSINMQHS